MNTPMISPLTLKSETTLIGTINPADAAQRWNASLGVDPGSSFKALRKIEYWRCDVTGLHWYTPAEAAGDGELYSQLERFDWYYMDDKWEFDAALAALKSGSRVLEVGVGRGAFLTKAKGADHSVAGVELNPIAAKCVRNMGFDVYEADLNVLAERFAGSFDAICSFQVLEHVPEPRQLLEEMIVLLCPRGRLILSVPNAAVMRRIDPERRDLLNQPPHHMTHWDESVFRTLEKLLPVKLLQAKEEPLASYHVDWFIDGWYELIQSKAGSTVRKILLNRVTMPFIKACFRSGLRRLVSGHTLLVVFERCD